MSTEYPEGNEPARGTGGRTPRVGDARSPVGSTLSIVLAVIAVVAGFLILRELTDDDGDSAGGDATTQDSSPNLTLPDDSTATGNSSVLGGATTTASAAPAAAKTGATIAVANASGVGGSAGAMSTALTTEGYEGVGEPGNSTGEQLSSTVVYYVATDTAAQAVAQSIATDLGGITAQAMPATRPAEGGATADATVLVMLGTDAAGKPIAELRAGAGSTPTTTG